MSGNLGYDYNSAHENSNEEENNSNTNESTLNKAAYVARGSYGCIVKPALDNVVEGVKKEFPGNVSKIFKSENSYNTALNSSNTAYNIMGKNEGHKLSEYEKNFKGSNLRRATRKGCKILGGKPIHVVRMKDLGKDIAHIQDYYKDLRKVPFTTIFEQVVKLIHQVYLVYHANYIHGDIRETNIMADPKTGVLTIIDFDWFMPMVKFFQTYDEGLGFYSNPPESIVFYELENFQRPKAYINAKLEHYRIKTNTLRQTPITSEEMRKIHKKNRDYLLIEKHIAAHPLVEQEYVFYETINQSFDSYGLAMSLDYLFRYVYPGDLKSRITNRGVPYTAAEIKVIEESVENMKGLFEKMIELEAKKRIEISQAHRDIKELFREYKAKIATATAYTTPPKKVKPTTPPMPVAPPSSPADDVSPNPSNFSTHDGYQRAVALQKAAQAITPKEGVVCRRGICPDDSDVLGCIAFEDSNGKQCPFGGKECHPSTVKLISEEQHASRRSTTRKGRRQRRLLSTRRAK